MNDKDIAEIVDRGVDPNKIIPGAQELKRLLKSNKKLNVYLGIDPTATRLHLGHAVPLRKLKKFSKGDHNVIFLIGDFTALVGDTSDKDSERPVLTPEEIEENFKTYKQQAGKILDFDNVSIRYNSEWLSKLTFADLITLAQKFSLNDFISRELIRKRLNEGRHIRLDEVLYPIMQGYDSYFLDTDIQIGAADQIFNMQAGRNLQRLLRNKESYVLPTEYLAGTDRRKMSKSFGNAIWLDDEPKEMYIKIMKIEDDFIVNYFDLATNLTNDRVRDFRNRFDSGGDRIRLKKELAEIIVSELHSKEEAERARENFEKTVQKNELPEDVPTFEMKPNEHLVITELLVRAGLSGSKSEAKRLVEQGAVEVDSDLVDSPSEEIIPEDNMLIKVGKRNFIRIKLT